MIRLIQLILLLGGLACLVAALCVPWAKADVALGLSSQAIHPYQNPSLHFVLLLIPFMMGGVLVAGIYSLLTSHRFITGLTLFILGAATAGPAIILWKKIEDNDIFFLGIGAAKIVNVHPASGVTLLMAGGGLFALSGLLYLIKPPTT